MAASIKDKEEGPLLFLFCGGCHVSKVTHSHSLMLFLSSSTATVVSPRVQHVLSFANLHPPGYQDQPVIWNYLQTNSGLALIKHTYISSHLCSWRSNCQHLCSCSCRCVSSVRMCLACGHQKLILFGSFYK